MAKKATPDLEAIDRAMAKPLRTKEETRLRDEFAMHALAGLIASNDQEAGDRIADLPDYAYSIADEMLKVRLR